MKTSDRTGPLEYTETKKTCIGCKHMTSKMLQSGLNPTYEYKCVHPDSLAQTRHLPGSAQGFYIGKEDETPDWCPHLNR